MTQEQQIHRICDHQEQEVHRICDHLERLLLERPNFTGRIEVNFKDGVPMDIQETRRTKLV
jgi:hypothetical protein